MNAHARWVVVIAVSAGALAGAGQQRKASPGPKPAPLSASTAEEAIVRNNNLGVALMDRQQFPTALAKFQATCTADPRTQDSCLNVGIALLNLQRFDEAEKALVQATERDSQNPRAWFNLGLLERAKGQPETAIAAFDKTADLDPNDADTQYFIGLLYSEQQKYDQAIAAFENALRLNPFHASAEFGLAQAEQRAGDAIGAKQHFDRFQHITEQKVGAPISFTYGDQGKYSRAQDMASANQAVPPTIPVRFVDVTALSGLPVDRAAATIESDTARSAPLPPEQSLAQFVGSGACIIDYAGDGKLNIFLVNADGKGNAALYRNTGHGKLVDATRTTGIDFHGEGTSCAVGDYDNDGHPDLAIGSNGRVALYHNEGGQTFKDVTDAVGIHTDGLVLGMTFIDYDHDGDLDLYITRFGNFPLADPRQPFSFPRGVAPSNVLWRNNGNGTFKEWTNETALGGVAPSIGVIGSDLNNDRAIDFVITNWQQSPTVLLNQREGAFLSTSPWATDMPGPTAGVVALDFDKDGWTDLAFTHWASPGLSLWRNVAGTSFERVMLPDPGWVRGWGITPIDYDNDGWIDLVAVGETASGEGRIMLLRNEGIKGFRDVTHETGLDKIALRNPRSVIAFDYDGDGSTDLLITQNNLPPVLLKNIGGSRNNWLKLALQGKLDSKTGIGTKIQIFAGTQQQKWELPGASGYLGQGPSEIQAGLGVERNVDVVRLLWPTGVLQDELQIPARKRDLISEIDRRGSSCPIVFVWNGNRFEFLADIIGPGIVGHWVGPGQRNVPDPDEYLKVEGSQAQIRNGRIQFRMIEPMEELDYLDQTRLLAVDHPADVEVYPNEYFASNPPFPKFKVIASRHVRLPAGAWDDRGNNVLPQLLKRDHQYVAGFTDTPYQGFVGTHSLELNIGSWDPARPLRLLMDGFTDYFTANSMYAAWQAGIQPMPPSVEALDRSGKWVRVTDDMGFPAGLARTMVADLTEKLPPGTQFIRITTNLKIYWDRIRVDNSAPDLPFRVTEIPLASAQLDFRGYPRVIEGNPKNDVTYVYADASPTGPYTRQVGNYTRYGDVAHLVDALDEKYVVFGSGDEVAVNFDATHLPELPGGWTRDYFFYADGFAKDMDFYAAHGDTVSPLPFHTLAPYPYSPENGYPEDEEHLKYLLEYNTRGVGGPIEPRFHFQYPSGQR
jgi:tetratricopeptide (TPR) repeat protein